MNRRKIIITFVSLIVLFSQATYATAGPSDCIWGMSKDDVFKIMGPANFEDKSDDNESTLTYYDQSISKFDADVRFDFINGALFRRRYDITGEHEYKKENYDYLSKALENKYGSPLKDEQTQINILAELFDVSDDEKTELIEELNESKDYFSYCIWAPSDDTYIILFFSNGEILQLIYSQPKDQQPQINMDGL